VLLPLKMMELTKLRSFACSGHRLGKPFHVPGAKLPGRRFHPFGRQCKFQPQTGSTTSICCFKIHQNQVAFTADRKVGRSSLHCTDVAKAIDCPVIRVNAENIEVIKAKPYSTTTQFLQQLFT